MLETIIDMQCDCPDPDCKVNVPSPYIVTLMASSERDVELLREIVAIVDGQLSRAPLRHLADLEMLVKAKMQLEQVFASTDVMRLMSSLGRPPNNEPSEGGPIDDNPFSGIEEIDPESLESEKP